MIRKNRAIAFHLLSLIFELSHKKGVYSHIVLKAFGSASVQTIRIDVADCVSAFTPKGLPAVSDMLASKSCVGGTIAGDRVRTVS